MSASHLTRRHLLGLGAGLSAATLAGCSEGSPSGTTPTAGTTAGTTGGTAGAAGSSTTAAGGTTAISVGVIPIVDVAPIHLGVEQGFFTDEGLDVTLEAAQGGAAIVPAVTSGSQQFGFSNLTSLMIAAGRGLGVQVVASGSATTGDVDADFGALLVRGDSPIQRPADLAGATVAVNTLQNVNSTTTNETVRRDGGDPSGIEYVELAFPDIVAAIDRGDVDAGQVVEPFRTMGLNQGLRSVGANYAVVSPALEIASYFTSTEYAEGNEAVVASFAAAMNRSLEFAQANPDEVRRILGTYTQISPEVASAMVLPRWSSQIDREAVELLAELCQTDGVLTAPPDLDALLP